jgi:hypothetical protein
MPLTTFLPRLFLPPQPQTKSARDKLLPALGNRAYRGFEREAKVDKILVDSPRSLWDKSIAA